MRHTFVQKCCLRCGEFHQNSALISATLDIAPIPMMMVAKTVSSSSKACLKRRAMTTPSWYATSPPCPCAVGTAYVVLFSVNFCLIATVAIAPPLELHEDLSAWPERARTTRFCLPSRCRSPHDTGPTFRTTFGDRETAVGRLRLHGLAASRAQSNAARVPARAASQTQRRRGSAASRQNSD